MFGVIGVSHYHAIYDAVAHDGAVASDMVSMKGYDRVDIVISVGVAAGTCAVTMDKDTSVGGSGTTTLAFTDYYVSGIKVPYQTWNGTAWTADETVTATGGLSASLEVDLGSHLLMYDWNGTTIVDGELMTGAAGATGRIIGAYEYEDTLIHRDAASDTFTMSATNNLTYVIPVTAEMLGDGYDCFHVDFADPSSTTVLMAVIAVFGAGRYKSYPTTISGIYD